MNTKAHGGIEVGGDWMSQDNRVYGEVGPTNRKGKRRFRLLLSTVIVTAVVVSAAFIALTSSLDNEEDSPEGESPDDGLISENARQPELDSHIVEVKVEADSITYIYDSAPDEFNYTVGDIIVGSNDTAYLRKITDIQQTG